MAEGYRAEQREREEEERRRREEAEPPKRPARVAERGAPYAAGLEEELRALLPTRREAAMRWLGSAIDPERGPEAEALEALLRRWIEERYPPPPPRGRKKK